jgi:hypothetical protein
MLPRGSFFLNFPTTHRDFSRMKKMSITNLILGISDACLPGMHVVTHEALIMVLVLQRTLRLLVLFTYIMLGQIEAFQLRLSVLAISQIQPTSKRMFCREPITGRNRNIVYANAQLPSDENRKSEVIYVDDGNMDDLPDDILTELDSSQPSELAVLKDVRYENLMLFQKRKYCISLLVYSFFSLVLYS